MKLQPVAKRFVLHWGEMGTTWGVSRTVAQILAFLFVTDCPMHAEEIAAALGVARSNVSTSMRELQNWKLVKVVHELGDRRDHFATITDAWELFRVVAQKRKIREFNPTVALLESCVDSPEFSEELSATRKRIRDTQMLLTTVSTWGDEMLKLEPTTLMKLLKLGSKIQNFLKKDKKTKD